MLGVTTHQPTNRREINHRLSRIVRLTSYLKMAFNKVLLCCKFDAEPVALTPLDPSCSVHKSVCNVVGIWFARSFQNRLSIKPT